MKKIFKSYIPFLWLQFLMIMNFVSAQTSDFKPINTTQIKSGDLIFVGAIDEGLSGAIKTATLQTSLYNYDHVGLIERSNDSIYVLHAAPTGGSQRESLTQFYQARKKDANEIVLYRLKNQYKKSIPDAIQQAKKMLGKPYNWEYILNEETYYCSDYVERAFRKDAIFEMIPMNFKNKSTGTFDQFWIDFYSQRNLAIPQDEPGTNPNQLSNSPKLKPVGLLKLNQTN